MGYTWTNRNGYAEICRYGYVIHQLFGATDRQVVQWIDKHSRTAR